MWDRTNLASIAELIKTGKTPPSKEKKFFGGQVKWYTPGDLNNGVFLGSSQRTLTELAFAEKKAVVFPKDTLLIACIGDIGKAGITIESCSSNQQITGIKPNHRVNVKYLYYWVMCNRALLQDSANNAVVPILNNRQLSSLEIPLPPLATQKKIAAILDAADAHRQKTKALLAKYDELAQSIFLEMFGDPVKNEKGWEVTTLRELVSEVRYGTSAKASKSGNLPYLRMNNITYEGWMDYDQMKYIDLPDKDVDKYSVSYGDVLFNRTNSKELVGKTGIQLIDETMVIAGYIIRVRPNEHSNSFYLWGLLNSPWAKITLQSMCKNIVGMANINAQELQNIKILKAPLELQQMYQQRVEQLVELKKSEIQGLTKSEELFNSLLQRAFKGELT